MRALFCTAVWGKAYIDRFLEFCLRSQITPGNLGVFGKESLYLIICRPDDVDRIKRAEPFQALAKILPVEIVTDIGEPVRGQNKYEILSQYQSYVLKRSKEFDVLFFGYADTVWAEGSYAAAMKRINEGYDAVFTYGFQTLEGEFPSFSSRFSVGGPGSPMVIPNRELAKFVYANLHPIAEVNFWDGRPASNIGSMVMWDVPSQGYLTCSFHLHPVAMRVRPMDPDFMNPFKISLDDELVGRCYRNGADVYVCSSSDELIVISLMEADDTDYRKMPLHRQNAGDIAAFAETHAGIVHREFFARPVRLVTDDIVEERWVTAEASHKRLVDDVFRRLSVPDSILELEAPTAYKARQHRLRVYGHWIGLNSDKKRKIDPINERIKKLIDEHASGIINDIVVSLDSFEKSKEGKTKSIEERIRKELLQKHPPETPDESEDSKDDPVASIENSRKSSDDIEELIEDIEKPEEREKESEESLEDIVKKRLTKLVKQDFIKMIKEEPDLHTIRNAVSEFINMYWSEFLKKIVKFLFQIKVLRLLKLATRKFIKENRQKKLIRKVDEWLMHDDFAKGPDRQVIKEIVKAAGLRLFVRAMVINILNFRKTA